MDKWFYAGTAVIPFLCATCAHTATDPTGAGATGANGTPFNVLYNFLGYAVTGGNCSWVFMEPITFTHRVSVIHTSGSPVTLNGGFIVPIHAWAIYAINEIVTATPKYITVLSDTAIACGGGITGFAQALPASGADPLCTGVLTLTWP